MPADCRDRICVCGGGLYVYIVQCFGFTSHRDKMQVAINIYIASIYDYMCREVLQLVANGRAAFYNIKIRLKFHFEPLYIYIFSNWSLLNFSF